jgi:hypothetical protein
MSQETLTAPVQVFLPPAPRPAAPARAAGERFFHLSLTAVGLVFLGVSVVALPLARLTVPLAPLVPRAALFACLLFGFAFYRWRKEKKLADLFIICFWSLVFGNLYVFPMYMAARSPVGMSDGLLAGVDRALGLEVPDVLAFMKDYPRLSQLLDVCYDLLLALVVLAILLPPLCGHMRRAKEYLITGIVSALITFPVFAAFQAEGPWSQYGYPPRADQQRYMATFTEVKADRWVELGFSHTDGLITFPSFHAVLAVLAAFALWPIRRVRWPAAVLAGLIVISTVTTGWHYTADVVAGLVIAALACAAAKGFTRLEARVTGSGGYPGRQGEARFVCVRVDTHPHANNPGSRAKK